MVFLVTDCRVNQLIRPACALHTYEKHTLVSSQNCLRADVTHPACHAAGPRGWVSPPELPSVAPPQLPGARPHLRRKRPARDAPALPPAMTFGLGGFPCASTGGAAPRATASRRAPPGTAGARVPLAAFGEAARVPAETAGGSGGGIRKLFCGPGTLGGGATGSGGGRAVISGFGPGVPLEAPVAASGGGERALVRASGAGGGGAPPEALGPV